MRYEGFVQAPISGPVTFTLLADDSARLVLRGEEIIMTANSTTTNSSGMAIVDMSEGDLVPVLLEMVEILDNATVVLLWMYDGLIAPTVIPSDALYYSRNLMGSPATIINVPGIPVAETSSITNAMDREYISCSATETCGVIIQSRDEAGNNVNNSGAHGGWIVSVEAIGGWALDGRVDEVVSGNPVSIDSTVVPMDWSGTSLGTVTCQLGSSVCVPWLDLGLDSGDEIVIGRERHVVAGFDTLALNTVEPFHEADGDYAVYLAGPLTGLYGATFTPTVVGDYALRVQMPPSSEVQVVRTSLDGVEGKIGGSFVVCESSLVGGTCSSDIPFDADATQFSTAIEEVFGIGSAIHTEVDGADCTVGCSWTVEFDAALGDVEDLVVDSSGLTGLGAKVDVEVIIPGMNQADIMGSPITVSVSPNSGSAARTTAYGKGLYSAIAGEVASFIVQVKDEAGNNRLGDEDSLAAYLVPPGNADYVKGHVEPLGEGSYNVSYTSNVSGDHTLAVYLSETSEIQQINLRMVEAGSFIISLGPGSADTTPSLAIDAPASSIAEALSALSYGAVNVTSSASQDVFTYTITFVDSVGDVPQSEVTLSAAAVENNPLATADSTTIVQGQASHIRTFSSPIISERQLLSVSASEAGSFTLSYRGRETPNIEIGASSGEVKAALESLDVIGSLTVDEISVDVYEGAYSILFQPEGASFSFGQWFTFGNIPELVVNSEEDTPEGFTSSVTSLVQGASPFAPVVHPAVRDPTGCMATQLEGVPDTEGLSKAQSGVLTTFSIESRDAFGNRITEGPQKEIQIISIAAEGGGEIAGSFSVSALGNSVEIAANAPPLVAEAALESLPGVGGISVTAPPSSCSLPVAGVQATVQFGSTEVSLSGGDASSILRLGDWVRICGTGGVYAIEALSSTSLTLSSAYLGIDSTNCALLYNDRERFSFVIAFDTSLGDQPPLKVDSSNLYDSTSTVAPENIVKDVINCDWNRNQEIYVEVGTVTGGSFLLGYGEQFTSQIPFNATAEQLEAALLSGINVISAVRITSGFPVWGIEILALEPNIPLLPLTPESYLLEGSGVRLGQRQACPSAHGVVTAAGRVGANWLATLDGPGSSLFHFEHSAYGVYSSSYLGPPAGTYSLTVQEAVGHGLCGTYWNNRWMYGDPAIERVDSIVDFSWSSADALTLTGRDYISIRWMGWVQPVFDGNYTFVTEVNDGARLWVNDELLFDEFETEASSEVEGSYETYSGLAQDLKGGVLYPIQLDFRENYNSATIRLLWSSDEQLLEIIPSYRLFYGETRIANSPFVVDVAPRKPGPPEGLSLEIIGADALQALFYPPADDGGESITSYLVEWWDASLDGLQTPEVQEIVIDSRIDGGTFVMTWPAGSGYANSRPLPWNATAVQVEYELESSNPELRDVSVDLDSSSHTYSVTFLSERGNVPYMLEVDPSSLTSSSVSVPIGDRVSINEIVPGVSVGTLWETMNVDKTTIPHRALVDGLSQDSTTPEGFSVRVSARNSAGAGLPCSAATMKPAAPPGPPPEGAIVLIPGSSTSLKVRWSHPVDDFGSIVTSFEVKYTPFGGSAIVMMGSTDTFSSLSRGLGHYDAILSSLPLGVPHLVSIAAVLFFAEVLHKSNKSQPVPIQSNIRSMH